MKLYKERCSIDTRHINPPLIVLLIHAIVYLQQSSLATVWLFLNES